MLSRSQIAEIRERAEKATPGPWDVDWNSPQNIIAEDGSGRFVANVGRMRSDRSDTDSDFIKASRTAIPALIDTIEAFAEALEVYLDGEPFYTHRQQPLRQLLTTYHASPTEGDEKPADWIRGKHAPSPQDCSFCWENDHDEARKKAIELGIWPKDVNLIEHTDRESQAL